MMRKYFPLEASERLFVAIEEDDVVDAQVSLPPTIALSCTTEIIHDNYALCLQFWLNGVNRQELLLSLIHILLRLTRQKNVLHRQSNNHRDDV